MLETLKEFGIALLIGTLATIVIAIVAFGITYLIGFIAVSI